MERHRYGRWNLHRIYPGAQLAVLLPGPLSRAGDGAANVDCELLLRMRRRVGLEKFLAKTNGKESLWLDWRSGLQGGNTLLPVLPREIRTAYSAS